MVFKKGINSCVEVTVGGLTTSNLHLSSWLHLELIRKHASEHASYAIS